MLSEYQNEFLRGLDAEFRSLTARNQRRSLAPAELARLEDTLAAWRAERPMHAAAGCGA
jgi:hypothetical protein